MLLLVRLPACFIAVCQSAPPRFLPHIRNLQSVDDFRVGIRGRVLKLRIMKSWRVLLSIIAVTVPAFSSPQVGAQPAQGTNEWARADEAMTAYLKKADPNMRSAIFASALLRKYLSDYRVYVRFDRHLIGETRIFVVNRAAEITPLPNEEWTGKDTEKFA